MKIDLLVGDNLYGTTVHFAKGLRDALERKGVETRLFWVGDGEFFHAFYAIMQDPPDLTCSFSDITVGENKPIGEMWRIPHLSILVDPPIYFLHQFQGDFSRISCVDLKDLAFVRECGVQNAFYFPHAGDKAVLTPVEKERPYEAVFFGSCLDYENLWRDYPEDEKRILHAAAEQVLSPADISTFEALCALNVREEDLPRFHAEVDQYTRGKDRVELLRAYPGPLHVWGEGPWENYLPTAHIHPQIPFEKTLEVMQQAKIVLNSSPRFKAGLHERICYGFLCGAAVLTGANTPLKKDLPNMPTYEHGIWEVPDLSDWAQIAAEGQAAMLQKHTWDARAQTLLDLRFSTRP